MKNLFLVVTIGPDYQLLPKFIKYYRNIGVNNFLVILNTPDVKPRFILENFNIQAVHVWLDPFQKQLNNIMSNK